MEEYGKTTSIYYRDLSQEEKEFVDKMYREKMMLDRQNLIKTMGLETADRCWWSKLDYINNWKHQDTHIFTKCECGSLEFDCLSDKQSGLCSRRCLMRCKKCKKKHIEYD